MLNNSNAVADRSGPTFQESKGETSQLSQQRSPFHSWAVEGRVEDSRVAPHKFTPVPGVHNRVEQTPKTVAFFQFSTIRFFLHFCLLLLLLSGAAQLCQLCLIIMFTA
jgi:hypothetical protein